MINRFSFLSILGMFAFVALPKPVLADISLGIATDTHTHTSTTELKPVSFIDLSKSYKVASVCFLGVGDCDPNMGFGTGDDYDIDTDNQCIQEGYVKNNCSSVQEPNEYCPHNKSYIKGCKCKTNLITCPSGQVGVGDSCGGKYLSCGCATDLKTCASNEVGIGTSCGGKYQSCSCKSEYQFTSSNCSYPRSVSGSSCGGKYNNCICPSGVSTGSYGCQEYYPSPCSYVCKVAKSDNCDKRTEVQTPYGCMSYFADCPSKCERAYTDNCRNRTAVTCQFGCTSYFADCQTKCQSCSSNNCDNRTAVSTPYGCQTYWSDCSSKCQTAYPDNCHNRTAVTCEYGCSAYFSDCSSKCQTCRGNPDCDVTALTCTNGCKTFNSCEKCTECNAENPSVTVYWSSPSPFKLVVLYLKKNNSSKIIAGQLFGSSGSLEYTDVQIGDTITFIDGYGIIEGSTIGSETQPLEKQVTVRITEGKNYSTQVRFTAPAASIEPLAYVSEVYKFSGGQAYYHQEYKNLLANARNTKLYSNYSEPEHYGVTTEGVDYSLRGPDTETNLYFYYTVSPMVSIPSYYMSAHCSVQSIKKNGSSLSFNNDSYVMISRRVGEAEMTVTITYNCQVY